MTAILYIPTWHSTEINRRCFWTNTQMAGLYHLRFISSMGLPFIIDWRCILSCLTMMKWELILECLFSWRAFASSIGDIIILSVLLETFGGLVAGSYELVVVPCFYYNFHSGSANSTWQGEFYCSVLETRCLANSMSDWNPNLPGLTPSKLSSEWCLLQLHKFWRDCLRRVLSQLHGHNSLNMPDRGRGGWVMIDNWFSSIF